MALEKLSGVSHSTISRIEKETSTGTTDKLERLAKALGVSFQELTGEEPQETLLDSIETEVSPVIEKQIPIIIKDSSTSPQPKKALSGGDLVSLCYNMLGQLNKDNYRKLPLNESLPPYILKFMETIKSAINSYEDPKEILKHMRSKGFEILYSYEEQRILGMQLDRFDFLPFVKTSFKEFVRNKKF